MYKKRPNTLYCFSPPVMIATMAIEVALAIITIFRKKSPLKNIASITLILLAVFQLAEYLVCRSYPGLDSVLVSKTGFVAITLLPPLGIHTANIIAKRQHNWSIYASYLLAAGFIGYFVFVPDSIVASICTGNYIIFNFASGAGMAYSVYYFTLLGCLLALTLYLAATQKQKNLKKAQGLLALGALSFLIPTAVLYLIFAQTTSSIPSVMCGFAVIYAIILTFGVVPLCKESK